MQTKALLAFIFQYSACQISVAMICAPYDELSTSECIRAIVHVFRWLQELILILRFLTGELMNYNGLDLTFAKHFFYTKHYRFLHEHFSGSVFQFRFSIPFIFFFFFLQEKRTWKSYKWTLMKVSKCTKLCFVVDSFYKAKEEVDSYVTFWLYIAKQLTLRYVLIV